MSTAMIEDLVRAVRPHGTGDAEEAYAASVWTGLVDPGDGVAGALVQTFGAATALDALRRETPPSGNREVADGFARWRPRLHESTARLALRNAAHLGVRLVLPGDDDWPPGLVDLGVHAPLALWALAPSGPLPAFSRSVALVGARACTPYGQRVTTDLGCGLADRGFAIVSGGAFGIDGHAHRAALASDGLTVAFLAGGLDRLYPSQHADLLRRIAATGALLSEAPPGTRPYKDRFLRRNRLIAAAARATVVVEAAARSGAANTAHHAAQLGRPLGAVPGSVYSASSEGCHALLRDLGAIAIRTAADAAELARDPDAAVTLDGLDVPEDPVERAVLDALAATRPRSSADVARRSGLGEPDVRGALQLLALTGSVRERPTGWIRA